MLILLIRSLCKMCPLPTIQSRMFVLFATGKHAGLYYWQWTNSNVLSEKNWKIACQTRVRLRQTIVRTRIGQFWYVSELCGQTIVVHISLQNCYYNSGSPKLSVNYLPAAVGMTPLLLVLIYTHFFPNYPA